MFLEVSKFSCFSGFQRLTMSNAFSTPGSQGLGTVKKELEGTRRNLAARREQRLSLARNLRELGGQERAGAVRDDDGEVRTGDGTSGDDRGEGTTEEAGT